MPYTLANSYGVFIERISLLGNHLELAKKRTAYVVERLGTGFDVLDAFPTGSLVRGTALRSHSDLDVLAVLHCGRHVKGRSPEAVLQGVRDHLGGSSKIVRKNGQAVTMYFTKWPKQVDVVPASRRVNDDGSVFGYHIPDMERGTWIRTRPRKHDNAIKRLTPDQRTLIQLAKAWNRAHSSYLQSFHLEVLVLGLSFPVTTDWSLNRPGFSGDWIR